MHGRFKQVLKPATLIRSRTHLLEFRRKRAQSRIGGNQVPQNARCIILVPRSVRLRVRPRLTGRPKPRRNELLRAHLPRQRPAQDFIEANLVTQPEFRQLFGLSFTGQRQ